MVALSVGDHNMSKEAPVFVMPEASPKKPSRKSHILLTSWASAATAILLVVLIGGAFYVADLKSRECTSTTNNNSEHKTKDYTCTYDRDGEKTTEDVHADEDDETELIIKKNDNGDIEMISAIDYKRKISASYVPRVDQCLLRSGTDIEWVDDWDGQKNETINVSENEIEEKSYMVSGNKVTDLSILPSALKAYCKGKATYWMQLADDDSMEAGRQKRGICLCRTLYIRCRNGYCYYFWYYYYCYC